MNRNNILIIIKRYKGERARIRYIPEGKENTRKAGNNSAAKLSKSKPCETQTSETETASKTRKKGNKKAI